MRTRTSRLAVAALVALAVSGCSDPGDAADLGPRTAPGTVTVGSSGSAASKVEALIYAGALRMAGTPVETRLGLGPGDDAAVAAVERGDITVAPALTGALWDRYRPGAAQPTKAKEEESENPRAQWDAQFVALSAVLPEGLGLGDPTLALDQPMLFAPKDAPSATLRGCEGLSGAVAVPAGSPSDLRARYGCATGPVVPVADEAAAARAVRDGRAALAQLGTLSAAAKDLVQVADPDGAVPSRAGGARVGGGGGAGARAARGCAVAGELTTADLAEVVARVESGERTPEQAAGDWAAEHTLK